MKREIVKSGDIHSIGYGIFSSKLEVEFTNGTIYQFLKVPFEVYNSLLMAPCLTTYLERNIKNIYRKKLIRDEFMF